MKNGRTVCCIRWGKKIYINQPGLLFVNGSPAGLCFLTTLCQLYGENALLRECLCILPDYVIIAAALQQRQAVGHTP